MTRTQEERFPSQEEADRYRGLFRLNQEIYTQHCEPNTVIMHPLPRDSRSQAQELDDDLIQQSRIWPSSDRQTTGCWCEWRCLRWCWMLPTRCTTTPSR